MNRLLNRFPADATSTPLQLERLGHLVTKLEIAALLLSILVAVVGVVLMWSAAVGRARYSTHSNGMFLLQAGGASAAVFAVALVFF